VHQLLPRFCGSLTFQSATRNLRARSAARFSSVANVRSSADTEIMHSEHRRRRRGRRGGTSPPKKKIGNKIFSRIFYVKFGHFFRQNHVKLQNFVNFLGKNHVKFGHFVNFSYIFSVKNVVPPKVD